MESLEATRLSLEPKQRGSEQGIEAVRRKRPDTGRICREWSRFTTLWEAATDEERADLLGSIVQVVEMTEKESVALELLPMPHSLIFYSNRFELKSRMGAAGEVIAINPPLMTTHTFPPVELDYDIIRPKRVMGRRAVTVADGVLG